MTRAGPAAYGRRAWAPAPGALKSCAAPGRGAQGLCLPVASAASVSSPATCPRAAPQLVSPINSLSLLLCRSHIATDDVEPRATAPLVSLLQMKSKSRSVGPFLECSNRMQGERQLNTSQS